MRNKLHQEYQSSMSLFYDTPEEVFRKLLKTYRIQKVYINHDYEPYALKRDDEIEQLLKINNVVLESYKDQVIFEKNDIVKKDGKPYVVYTPYKNSWKIQFDTISLNTRDTFPFLKNTLKNVELPYVTL